MNRKNEYADMDKYRKACYNQRKRYYQKTQLYSKRAWTEEEENQVIEHLITDSELSVRIQRSVGAIQDRRCLLKKGRNK